MADRQLTLPSYGARFRDIARRSGLADFWQWWRGELVAVVPSAPRTALARRRMRPVLVFAGDRATLWSGAVEEGRPVMQPMREIALADAADGSAAIGSLGAAGRAPRVVLSLNPQDYLRKRLTLPAALEENLTQALAYDLDRHTPFKPEELYFDAAVIERNPARGTIAVDLAAARRTAVDPALKHIAAWGAEVAAVVPEPPATASQSRLNLLPPELRRARPLLRRFDVWIPLVLIGVLALAAAAIPVWQKRNYAQELATEADQARARAAISENLRAQLNARVADYNFALERKYAFPGALAVVDTVSRILPDDTWLTQFEIKTLAKGKDTQRDVMLRGETANAGRLVQLFEESQIFALAAQRGPTTKIQPGPGEIFDLGAQLKQQRRQRRSVAVAASGARRDAARGVAARWPHAERRRGGAAPAAARRQRRPPDAARRPPPAARRLPRLATAEERSRDACGDRAPFARRATQSRDRALRARRRRGARVLLGPVVYLHRRYDIAIADTSDRLERYRRVAAQAPELRQALEVMKEKDGRRFYLKNTAPNLASAELADLVRTAIENNGGRITTSQNPGSRDEGSFRQLTVNVQFFATMPALAKILYALDRKCRTSWSTTCRSGPSMRFAASSPRRARNRRTTSSSMSRHLPTRRRLALPPPLRNERRTPMNTLRSTARRALVWIAPVAVLALLLAWQTDWGRAFALTPPPRPRRYPRRCPSRSCLSIGPRRHPTRTRTRWIARSSIRRAGPRPWAAVEVAKPRMQRGQFTLSGTIVVDGKTTAFLQENQGRQGAPRRARARSSTG